MKPMFTATVFQLATEPGGLVTVECPLFTKVRKATVACDKFQQLFRRSFCFRKRYGFQLYLLPVVGCRTVSNIYK